jgi:beta-phosphoglucomutase-like phosphatase (HAD superfamily)
VAALLNDVVGLAEPQEELNAEVLRRILMRYEEELPLIEGAAEAVRRVDRFRLAVASSSNRELIDGVLDAVGLADFEVTVPPRKSPAASPRRMSTSKLQLGSVSTRLPAS